MAAYGKINLVAPFAGIIKDGLMLSLDGQTGQVTAKMSLEQFRQVIDVNLIGVFLTVRDCAEQMINNGDQGLICLVSSIGSLGTADQLNVFVVHGRHIGNAQGYNRRIFSQGCGRTYSLCGGSSWIRSNSDA